ncbi:unnamed protein product [Calypogeia fissa]
MSPDLGACSGHLPNMPAWLPRPTLPTVHLQEPSREVCPYSREAASPGPAVRALEDFEKCPFTSLLGPLPGPNYLSLRAGWSPALTDICLRLRSFPEARPTNPTPALARSRRSVYSPAAPILCSVPRGKLRDLVSRLAGLICA